MIYCVGIDPSMNSTGISCIELNDNLDIISEKFYIVTNGKLTKREKTASETYADIFKYLIYDRIDPRDTENNHEFERAKTLNMISVVDEIKKVVDNYVAQGQTVYIVQEGISYGSSIRTKSIFDLAGLNYLIRNAFIKMENVSFIIATPSEIKKFATGKGNCKKEDMINIFQLTHPDFNLPKLDDVADSYWMAQFAKELLKQYKQM